MDGLDNCICNNTTLTEGDGCYCCRAYWTTPMRESIRKALCPQHGTGAFIGGGKSWKLCSKCLDNGYQLAYTDTDKEPTVFKNGQVVDICTCKDMTKTNTFSCFHCKTTWLEPMDDFERQAECPKHYWGVSHCCGGGRLCSRCKDSGYQLAGGYIGVPYQLLKDGQPVVATTS